MKLITVVVPLSALINVVVPENIHPRRNVANNVIREFDVRHHGPWGGPVLVSWGELNRKSALCSCPNIFENVTVDSNVICIFELKNILYRPRSSPPRGWLKEVIVFDCDITRHEVWNPWIPTADHGVLAGSL